MPERGLNVVVLSRLRLLSWSLLAAFGGCGTSPILPPFKSSSNAPGLTFLDLQGPIASAQRAHLIAVVLIVLIVVLPFLILTPIFAWRYR